MRNYAEREKGVKMRMWADELVDGEGMQAGKCYWGWRGQGFELRRLKQVGRSGEGGVSGVRGLGQVGGSDKAG